MFETNEIVYIENEKGNYTPCLFKGYIDEKTCFVKPKEKFKKRWLRNYDYSIDL